MEQIIPHDLGGKSHINLLSAQPDIVNVQIIGMWMHAWMRQLKNGLINNLKMPQRCQRYHNQLRSDEVI